MITENDPPWVHDEQLTESQLWEQRAREQLERARRAEVRAKVAEDRAQDLEWERVKAVGTTMEAAVRAFFTDHSAGEEVTRIEEMSGADDNKWGARCLVNGTSMKAWGIMLPGGFGVTGWK